MELGREEKSALRETGWLRAAEVSQTLGDTEKACQLLKKILLARDGDRRVVVKAKTVAASVGCTF